MGVEIFNSNSNLLMVWFFGLIFTIVTAVAAGLSPGRLERIRKSAFAMMILPGLLFALVYSIRGFGVLERPLVHWVFSKDAQDSLRLGLVFDPLSFAAAVFPGLAIIAIAYRNRPSIRTSSALALSWVALGLAATSQTLWMASLGIGVQLLSRTLPLIEDGGIAEVEDSRWIASTKRAWIGLACVLCGGAGLASLGVHLDFFLENSWSSLETTPSTLVAGGLLIFGLLVMAAPAFASNALYSKSESSVEENLFISEASLAWISVVVFFRLFASVHDPVWLLTIGVGATVATVGSLGALTFQTAKGSAIHLWLSTFPVAMLMVLPFIPTREAGLYILGGLLVFSGLWVSLDHQKSKLEVAAAAAFLLGAFGFVGWATSAGMASFFSRAEEDPLHRAPVFIVLLLYSAFGWRLVVRGGEREGASPAHAKWIVLGLLLILGFGPLLSGRWGGGAIPGEPDWIEGAKNWDWVKGGAEGTLETDWTGFGIAQGLGLVAALIGVFAWRTSELFPFAKKYPRGGRAAQGLFGLVWLQDKTFGLIQRSGRFWTEMVTSRLWEKGIPAIVVGTLSGFRKVGTFAESAVDPLTSNGYGRLFTPAAKLVQWLHGGNVRLYAWFALIWILIFSIYLTR